MSVLEDNIKLIHYIAQKVCKPGTLHYEDVVQSMCITFLELYPSFNPDKGKLATYVYRPLIGSALRAYRASSLPVSLPKAVGEARYVKDYPEAVALFEDSAESPEEVLDYPFSDILKHWQVEVLYLRFWEKRSFKYIGMVLDIETRDAREIVYEIVDTLKEHGYEQS